MFSLELRSDLWNTHTHTHTQSPTRMEWSARCRALPLSPVVVTGWHIRGNTTHSPLLRAVATRSVMKRAPLLTGANFFPHYCFFLSRSASFLAAWANRTPPGCFNVIIHSTSPSCSRIFRLMRHRRTHSPRLKNWGLGPTPLKWRNNLIGWNSSPIKQLAGEYRFKVFTGFAISRMGTDSSVMVWYVVVMLCCQGGCRTSCLKNTYFRFTT